jgi:hypothetical protein
MRRLQLVPACATAARKSLLAKLIGATVFLALNASTHAAIFHCVSGDGTVVYSDRTCDSPTDANTPKGGDSQKDSDSPKDRDTRATGVGPGLGGSDAFARRLDSAREKKAAHILDLLRIAPAEPETSILRRTVDDAAPDLIKALDPDNAKWTPANGRWHSVSEFVKADLARDVQSSLRVTTGYIAQVTAREFASRAQDADLEALSAYLASPDGGRYIAMQNEIRPLLYAALAALQAQDPVPEEVPDESVLRQRRQLLSMALEYCVVREGGPRSTTDLRPGSVTVVENTVRREGVILDALYAEYEASLGSFQSFTDSALAKRFFVAVEPAIRTEMALSSTATTDFAEQEFDKYVQRWRAVYGPPLRVTTRTTISIRGRIVSIAHTTQSSVNVAGSPEGMAIQCEQREDVAYQQAHRNVRDSNAQAFEMKAIQDRCRAEQRLLPL